MGVEGSFRYCHLGMFNILLSPSFSFVPPLASVTSTLGCDLYQAVHIFNHLHVFGPRIAPRRSPVLTAEQIASTLTSPLSCTLPFL